MANRFAVMLLAVSGSFVAGACMGDLVVGPMVYVENDSPSVYLVTAISADAGMHWTYQIGPRSAGAMGDPYEVNQVEVRDPTDCHVVASGDANGPYQNVGMFRVTIDGSGSVNIAPGPMATDIPDIAANNLYLPQASDCRAN